MAQNYFNSQTPLGIDAEAFGRGIGIGNELTQSRMNRMQVEDYAQERESIRGLRQAKTQAELQDIKLNAAKQFVAPAQALMGIYDRALQQTGDPRQATMAVQPYYEPIRNQARQAGLEATETYDNNMMKVFAAQVQKLTGKDNLPYKIGSLNKFYENGKEYQGVFTGLDAQGLPIFQNKQEIPASAREGSDKAFTQENQLRQQYLNQNKPFSEVRDAYARIQESVKEPSAAGDLALIFNYMKMLDPGSVVREGEFATAQNAAGIPDRIRAQYNKVISGERLAPATRSDFLSRSKGLYASQENQYKQSRKEFRALAKKANLSEDIFPELSVNFGNQWPPQPKGNQAPASGAQIAPAGTKAKLQDGRIVTSDGKGGWN